MKAKSGELELTPGQKTRLFRLGLEAEPSRPGEQGEGESRAVLLYRLLTSRLPVQGALAESLPAILRGACGRMDSIAGAQIENLLLDPKVDVSVLRRIKDHCKLRGSAADSQVEKDVLMAVYYAAIAAAVVLQAARITKHTDQHLGEAFERLRGKPWMTDGLSALFAKARQNLKVAEQHEQRI